MYKSLLIALSVCAFAATALAHSWVACTDYKVENGDYYDDTKCKGYARGWSRYAGTFGVDRGADYVFGLTNQKACKEPRGVDDYTPQYPMARYVPGQRVCLAWPSKNHVAAPCTNPYMPDGGVKIFRSGVNATQDPSVAEFQENLVADLGKGGNGVIDFKGFQNCPKFCENPDKSLCSGCFQIPRNLPRGIYTFQWFWEFNAGQYYAACWEAGVGNGTFVLPTKQSTTNPTSTTASSSSATKSSTSATQSSTSATKSSTQGTSASTATTSTPTTGTCQSSPVCGLDYVQLIKWPCTVSSTGAFSVEVQYNSLGSRVIVVDLLKRWSNEWYGKGLVRVSNTKGASTITIQTQNNPPSGEYILKAWIVDASIFDSSSSPWNSELYKVEVPVTLS